MTAYYNECDPYAAQWIRNLIRAGLVAPGEVDERSIEDVSVLDLAGFRQVHMFAGIAGWSLALRQAGIPDDREVWTGSCPCQPFSAAGKRGGFDDSRHLWPAFYGLIAARRPAAVMGEQVASPDGVDWLESLWSDLECANYEVRAADLCAAGVGAPHIRQRLYWMAHAAGPGLQGGGSQWAARPRNERGAAERSRAAHRLAQPGEQRREWLGLHVQQRGQESPGVETGRRGETGGLADADVLAGRQSRPFGRGGIAGSDARAWPGSGGDGVVGRQADAERERVQARESRGAGSAPSSVQGTDGQRERLWPDAGAGDDAMGTRPGPTDGFWRAADWLYCRDDKWRPIEPGLEPLVDGASARIGRLRAYGNAICIPVAVEFIRAVMA